jgi:hypothetical protein
MIYVYAILNEFIPYANMVKEIIKEKAGIDAEVQALNGRAINDVVSTNPHEIKILVGHHDVTNNKVTIRRFNEVLCMDVNEVASGIVRLVRSMRQFLKGALYDVEQWGKTEGYPVYHVYSQPADLVVPSDMTEHKTRLQVSTYTDSENNEIVMDIERYEGGVLVESVHI